MSPSPGMAYAVDLQLSIKRQIDTNLFNPSIDVNLNLHPPVQWIQKTFATPALSRLRPNKLYSPSWIYLGLTLRKIMVLHLVG